MRQESKGKRIKFIWTETFKSVFINAGINLGMAYFLFRSVESIRLWGAGGLFTDLAATVIIMPFLMTLVMTKALKAKARKGSLPILPRMHGRQGRCSRLIPEPLLNRGIAVAGLALLTVLPVTTASLLFWGQFPMSLKNVLILKTIFGGVIAAVATPVIIARVLQGPLPRQ